jgi:hypothetical protein
MNYKILHRITAALVFLITLIAYFATVQPSVSFWDCGEFVASAYSMQVPHPPGTPFFLILGRLFSMIPFVDNIALRVNTVSVLSSAFTALFLYLVAVKIIFNYMKKEPKNLFDALTVFVPAAIGALSLSFSDTFWFNGVEAEVYAHSTFYIAIVTWLMMVWNEKADEEGSEKYLILIFYLIGLSTGVHLMSVLAIVSVVMIVLFRKYITDEKTLKSTGIIFVIHSAVIIVVAMLMWMSQTTSTPPNPADFGSGDMKYVATFGLISLLFMGALYKKIFQRNSFYIPIIVGGIALIAVYPGLVKYFPKLISAIAKNDFTLDILVTFVIFGIVGYGIYWTSKNKKATFNLVLKCLFFAMLGVTSYAMMIIRANQDTPINMNSPKTFTELESYLNREQYGDFPTFMRRYSSEPHQMEIYTKYSNDLDFVWTYQINHMFNRYLFWNYVGRESSDQDSGVDWTDLFGIPFFVGLFGLYWHFKKDWKMASVFLVMFIFLGYLTAFYQNQQEPQPRERDYFYVGAFFVFSIWIALGMRGIIELITEKIKEQRAIKPFTIAILVLGFVAIPVSMLKANWFEHNRSRIYVPWDYAYNLLQSVEPNAVLFTNGDNDTFPLWYLQDVEGVRRDVRIANLSLLNTPWYIRQLKDTSPYGAQKINMSYSDQEIEQVGLSRWDKAQQMSIPVSPDIIKKYNITDSAVVKTGRLTWLMRNTAQYGDVKVIRTQDLIVLDIIAQAKWERPVYFAVTCSDDSRISLEEYLRMDGMALKIVPQKSQNRMIDYINEPMLRKQLMEEPSGYSKNFQPGFKFRGLNDKTIFFDENHQRLTQNYRNAYLRLALYYLNQERNDKKVIETLDMMDKRIPRAVIPMDYRIEHDIAKIYLTAGDIKQYEIYAKEVIAEAKKQIALNPRSYSNYYNPYEILLTHYENLKRYDEAIELLNHLGMLLPDDPSIQQMKNKFQVLSGKKAPEITKK